MSLLTNAMVPVVVLDKSSVPDGEGGITSVWTEGAEFNAAIVFDSTLAARVAQKQGVTSLYTITVPKGVKLDYHDVLRQLSDGKVYRITSDADEKQTPESASIQVRQYTAEEWSLT